MIKNMTLKSVIYGILEGILLGTALLTKNPYLIIIAVIIFIIVWKLLEDV